ncbi:MAG TPA: flippase-like domain-containing protein [Xanthobacteraceae bacterium]|nr:flippase-like domain-containing protein [Xanthobacteraceae bacterium]
MFYLLVAGGAALFTFLLIHQGAPQVIAAFASAQWWIAAVVLYHLAIPVLLDALAWWSLFPRSERLALWELLWMRWIGESVSTLVPSASVGGDVVRARLAALDGVPIPTAAASVLVDITLGVFVQIGFTLLGLTLIVTATGHQNFVRPTLIGAVIGVLAILGFYFVQRLGMFRFIGKMISRLANADDWHSLVHSGHTLDEAIRRQYARRSGVVGCCAWTGTSLLLGSGEIWIALHALGLHATMVNAVILQSMVLTIRSAMFPVPGALGVQEGGYVIVGNLLGIPGDAAFALSLIARVRELILGIPGLIVWQVIEGRRVFRARAVANAR